MIKYLLILFVLFASFSANAQNSDWQQDGLWNGFINVTPAGNVGIGTTAPSTALQVVGTITATGYAGLPTRATNAESYLSFQPGLITTISNNKSAFYKIVSASTVDNLIISAQQFSCTGNPTITMYECGTSTTCATPTTIGTATPTAAATAFPGTISNSGITAGDYVAFAISAGTCVTLDVSATAQIHSN